MDLRSQWKGNPNMTHLQKRGSCWRKNTTVEEGGILNIPKALGGYVTIITEKNINRVGVDRARKHNKRKLQGQQRKKKGGQQKNGG